MDYKRELEAIDRAETKAKRISGAAESLRYILATLAEIEDGAAARVRLDCGNGAELDINSLLNGKEITAYIKRILEEKAERQFSNLLRVLNPEAVAQKAAARIETPEKIKTELVKEIPERKPKAVVLPIVKATTTDTDGKEIINEKALADAYFKNGMGVHEIGEASGLDEDVIFSTLEKIKAAREKAARECARR